MSAVFSFTVTELDLLDDPDVADDDIAAAIADLKKRLPYMPDVATTAAVTDAIAKLSKAIGVAPPVPTVPDASAQVAASISVPPPPSVPVADTPTVDPTATPTA